MIIKIDVDGVIRNITKPMTELYERDFGDTISEDDFTDYDVDVVFPKLNGKAREYFFIENGKYVFKDGATVIDGAKEAIDILHNAGHKIVIVTWQIGLANKIYTLQFLEEHGIYYDDICFTRDKDIVFGDVIIDDNPEFLENEENALKVCVNAPYNANYNPLNTIKVNKLFDLTEILAVCGEVKNKNEKYGKKL